ncbi:peptidase inhibitor family I36 protein [Cryptosporangium phraense]|uniref:Peptidase inhibitor family I36 protein n=1 Tax=Cryptosporangium phraense TaxID=2593070 RepID=A0A545ANW6_9ACTN|nr:peptidase inhibitor family I36 protein [Cryptosporangium phraense]TQS43028.1 hypothetical protein FL583_21575 [Cryptosporangium phraense]
MVRKVLAVALSVVLSLLVAVQPADAAAPSCPSGSFCIWPVHDHSSGRCSWSNADADWQTAPVVCSWAATRPVQYLYNNGTSSSYAGVCIYIGANYSRPSSWASQGQYYGILGGGDFLRSHRWLSSDDSC